MGNLVWDDHAAETYILERSYQGFCMFQSTNYLLLPVVLKGNTVAEPLEQPLYS